MPFDTTWKKGILRGVRRAQQVCWHEGEAEIRDARQCDDVVTAA